MAITSITVQPTAQGAAPVQLTGAVEIAGVAQQVVPSISGSTIQLQLAAVNSIWQQGYNLLLAQPPLITINNIGPAPDGTFFVLGSPCTHVVQSDEVTEGDTDNQESITVTANHVLVTDQCPACNDCDTQWQLAEQVQDLGIWLAAMKDNNIYGSDVSSDRWTSMLELLITGINCPTAGHISNSTVRSSVIDPAIKLFGQYRALVDLWNALVIKKTTDIELTTVAGDLPGFNIQISKQLNQCLIDSNTFQPAVTLAVTVTLVSGQTSQDTVNKALDQKLKLYICNTAAEETLTGVAVANKWVSLPATPTITNSGLTTVSFSTVYPTMNGETNISAPAQFTFQTTIMPFIVSAHNAHSGVDLDAYAYAQAEATEVYNTGSINRFQINLIWTRGSQTLQSQTRYVQISCSRCPVIQPPKSSQSIVAIYTNSTEPLTYYAYAYSTPADDTINWVKYSVRPATGMVAIPVTPYRGKNGVYVATTTVGDVVTLHYVDRGNTLYDPLSE